MAQGGRLRAARAVAARVERAGACVWSVLVGEFGASAVKTALRNGLISRVLPGIYVIAGTERDFRVRAMALTLWAAPTGTITGLAGAHLWGMADKPPSRITIQVPPNWHKQAPPWARTLRVDPPLPRFRVEGIRVVPTADAIIQVWREAAPDVAASTVIASIADGRSRAAELLEAVERRKQLPRRGELVELLALAGVSVTSYLEYIARRDAFPPSLFPQLSWQVAVWAGGRKRVMDACDPEAMIDLEFDGYGTHGGERAFERDRERDNDIRSLGYEPLHYPYRDLTTRAEWCRRNYLEVRATRLRQLGFGASPPRGAA